MAQLARLSLVRLDGQEWWACPVGCVNCGRVLVAAGTWVLDALEVHMQREHRDWWWQQRRREIRNADSRPR